MQDGGIRIATLELKFLDRRKTDRSESICQECFLWSRTRVKGPKEIRYRPISNQKNDPSLAEAFRCHVHNFQCLTVTMELKISSKLNKLLLSEVNLLIQHTSNVISEFLIS